MPTQRTKITHLITGLEAAGAEQVLLTLLERADRSRFDMEVITLVPGGALAPRVEALGLPFRSLGMRRGQIRFRAVGQLARWLKHRQPDAVVSWMYHANLLGSAAARLAGGIPVVWNIHNSDLARRASKLLTRITSRTCARLSRRMADRIVYVSEASQRSHIKQGYCGERSLVIPNGFDVQKFRPDPGARNAVRSELRIPEGAPVVGLLARFHPQKDHKTFLAAASRIHEERPDVHFLLCGKDISESNPQLSRWIAAAELGRSIHLLGSRTDIPRLQASLDVAVLSSSSEAFPLVIGEAMSCGTVCAVTDVGDTALLVGPTGRVSPAGDWAGLADACLDLLGLPERTRCELGREARRRIESQFNIQRIAEQYYSLWSEYGVPQTLPLGAPVKADQRRRRAA